MILFDHNNLKTTETYIQVTKPVYKNYYLCEICNIKISEKSELYINSHRVWINYEKGFIQKQLTLTIVVFLQLF